MNIELLKKVKEQLTKEYKENVKIYDKQTKWFELNDIAYIAWKYGPIPVKITGIYEYNGYYSYYFEEEDVNFIDRIKEKLNYYNWFLFKKNKEPYLPDIKFGIGTDIFLGRDEGLYLTKEQAEMAYYYSTLIDSLDGFIHLSYRRTK
jgi:hypothetical protein